MKFCEVEIITATTIYAATNDRVVWFNASERAGSLVSVMPSPQMPGSLTLGLIVSCDTS